MPNTEKNIATGQYWLDKDSRIIVIRGNKATSRGAWSMSFVDERGTCNLGFSRPEHLVQEITPKEAEEIAVSYVTRKAKRTLFLK